MKIIVVLVIAVFFFSFCPTAEKLESTTHNGFLITIEDHTTRTFHKYLVESKDSVNIIFNEFFNSELELGVVDRPMSIDNGKHEFFIARVNLFTKPNGKKSFKNLKYPPIYIKSKDRKQREQRDPVYM
ncbi:hypothetical protein ACUNWD_12385 [Sunxiuqinia sp. A32]|uniref:hypothetical protein n=1 Tax=Sunxiuqinia sp. A32 TaxID=3461496 RepID=UPI004045886F